MALRAVCDSSGSSPLICVAQSYCSGLYRCPDPSGDNADVTARVEWTVEHPDIVRQDQRPNWFVAVAPGDTVIRLRDRVIQQDASVRLSVFPGTVPLLTTEVWGRVWEAGTSPRIGIGGAVVEITNGLVAGRTSTTGIPQTLLPGYFFLLGGSDGYQIFGVPRGTYELTVRAQGYVSQTRTVTVMPPGSPSANFELVRQ